jgi:TRAP-type uncharacterized transport system fused permease subunit
LPRAGIWGSLAGVSVSVVAIFVIFGAVLNAGEAGQGFMNVAAAAAGRLKGGAAKVSVISSALFGSISGSASANVASTGAITLPAMTRLGYPKRLAGGGGGGGVLGRADHAAADGGRRLRHGRADRRSLHRRSWPRRLLPAILYFFAVWVGINALPAAMNWPGWPKKTAPRRASVITSAFFLYPSRC